MKRYYRIVVAENQGGLQVAANGWTILGSTVRAYEGLDTGLSAAKAGVGNIRDQSSGWVALAYKDA